MAGACGLDVVGSAASSDASSTPSGQGGLPDAASATDADDATPPPSDGAVVGSDAGGAIAPSHVNAPIDPSAPDVSGVIAIDTGTRTIAMFGGAAAPNVRFESLDGRRSSSSVAGTSIATS